MRPEERWPKIVVVQLRQQRVAQSAERSNRILLVMDLTDPDADPPDLVRIAFVAQVPTGQHRECMLKRHSLNAKLLRDDIHEADVVAAGRFDWQYGVGRPDNTDIVAAEPGDNFAELVVPLAPIVFQDAVGDLAD